MCSIQWAWTRANAHDTITTIKVIDTQHLPEFPGVPLCFDMRSSFFTYFEVHNTVLLTTDTVVNTAAL